jgi:carbamate kinase
VRIVIALGGNALLRRGQPMTADNQRANIRSAAERIAEIAEGT